MGLTAATLILELGLKVTVYAKEFWKDTTSRVAGGQWAPSSVKYSNESMFKDALKIAYNRLVRDIGQGLGVSKKVNYTPRPDPYLDIVVSLVLGLNPAPVPMNLPFEHLTSPGFMYRTLLIETPTFLEKLDRDSAKGCSVQTQYIHKCRERSRSSGKPHCQLHRPWRQRYWGDTRLTTSLVRGTAQRQSRLQGPQPGTGTCSWDRFQLQGASDSDTGLRRRTRSPTFLGVWSLI